MNSEKNLAKTPKTKVLPTHSRLKRIWKNLRSKTSSRINTHKKVRQINSEV